MPAVWLCVHDTTRITLSNAFHYTSNAHHTYHRQAVFPQGFSCSASPTDGPRAHRPLFAAASGGCPLKYTALSGDTGQLQGDETTRF